MADVHNSLDHLGTTCQCGTHHRVFDSLPASPLTGSMIDQLRASERIHFVRGITMRSPDHDSNEEVTEDVVLSTDSKTLLLSFYEEVGWVVEQEIEHRPGEDPETVGLETWTEVSDQLSTVLNETFDR